MLYNSVEYKNVNSRTILKLNNKYNFIGVHNILDTLIIFNYYYDGKIFKIIYGAIDKHKFFYFEILNDLYIPNIEN